VEEKSGPGGEQVRIQNFFDAIRTSKHPNSEIEEGYTSTMLCHVGTLRVELARRWISIRQTGTSKAAKKR